MSGLSKEFIQAIHRGIYDANFEYEQWSHGYHWLNDSGNEGLLVAGIARALHEQCQGRHERLWLEMPFHKIWADTAGECKQKRVDIALLDKCEKPICVIEVKRYWDKDRCLEDLDRIKYLVGDGPVPSRVLAVLVVRDETNQALNEALNQARADVAEWHARPDNRGVNICCHTSVPWGYPMIWRFGHEYPKYPEWRSWKGASICIEISRP